MLKTLKPALAEQPGLKVSHAEPSNTQSHPAGSDADFLSQQVPGGLNHVRDSAGPCLAPHIPMTLHPASSHSGKNTGLSATVLIFSKVFSFKEHHGSSSCDGGRGAVRFL